MDERFIAERITALRMKRNVSEYRMSLELGQSKSYIQGITSGKALPSVKQLFNLADYFDITMSEFFDEGTDDPEKMHEITELIKQLNDEDFERILDFAKRLVQK